jgi:diacylglycerol kinase family enzyme
VSPRRAHDWVVLLARGVLRRHRPDRRLATYQAREVDIRLPGRQPRQLDGDLIADGTTLHARVEPGALVVRVARPAGDATEGEDPAQGDR